MRGYLFLSDLITAHEPGCPLTRPAGTLSPAPSGGEGRERGRFMGREHLQNSDVNRGHEPVGIPLNRPPGTFSPTGGEGRDEGVRFMESPLSFFACIGTMNHPLTRPPGTLS